MKIVFFEVASWEKDLLIKNFPEAYLVEDKLNLENVAKYQDAEIISSFVYSQLAKDILEKMPNLKFIATRSTGFDHIDISYCRQRNIKVSNVPEYGSRTVAEHTFALILTLTKKIYQSINQAKNFDFNHENIRGIDLFGKTIGIVGLGKIGFEVLKIAQGFGMRILVFNRSQKQELKEKYNFDYVDLKTLVSQSDIVSLHLPYNKETHHLINKNNIFDFKKGSYLINTARGPVVETEAIILGLEKGIFDGVGLDVLEEEKELAEETEILTKIYKKDVDLKTIVLNHVLVNHPKVIITPHNAFNTKEALERITKTTIENIKAFLNDSSINLV
ncbi:MAG: NAD(P)-binding domain-containing protein [Patescibacteria group bacterium]|nr:NAD(P)-binding domain-containing protein [Patescibacteria group bacterium]